MKITTVVSVLQTAAIVFLAIKIVDVDSGSVPDPSIDSTIQTMAAQSSTRMNKAVSHDRYVTTDELRTIFAEELRSQLGAVLAVQNSTAASDPFSELDQIERHSRVDLVTGQIDYYRSVGSLSVPEMEALQMEIARLDKRDRQPMLNKLVQAMNAGEIGGNF